MPLLIASLLLGALFLVAFHWLIRRSLAAPRIPESGTPPFPCRELRLPTGNGKQLFAWLGEAAPGAPAIVIMHGWGGNAEMMLPLATPLFRAGYTVLLVDARCHGRSDMDSFASLPRFAEDIQAAVAWLAQQLPTPPAGIGVLGHSVGAGAALLAASKDARIAAVASLAAFAHPGNMMRRWLGGRGIPYFPLGAYILAYVQRTIGHRFDAIAPRQTISALTCPVLLMHGEADATVPVAEAHAIFAGRRHERVELRILPGNHEEAADLEAATGHLLAFFAEHLAAAPRERVAEMHGRPAL